MAKDKTHSCFFDRETNKFHGIDSQILTQLQETYDGIVIENELKRWVYGSCLTKARNVKGTSDSFSTG